MAVERFDITDVGQMVGTERRDLRRLFAATMLLAVVAAGIGVATAPKPLSLTLLVLVSVCTIALVLPQFGVYSLIVLTLIGDTQTMPWWPFGKNLSSKESIAYVSDALTVTPLELVLLVTGVSVVLHLLLEREWPIRVGRMTGVLALFSLLVLVGYARGYATGGDQAIAIVEVRPLLYLPAMYVLLTHTLRTRQQYRLAFLLAILAVSLQSVFALFDYRSKPAAEREILESLGEHTASVQLNVVFIVFLALIMFRGARWRRLALLPLLVPVTFAYLLARRRAAMVALFVGLIVLLATVFVRRRKLFWVLAPTVVLLGLGFILATWNAEGSLGLPSTAVKSVLFPDQLSTRDRNSSIYRDLEAYNLWITVRASPLLGLGFGQPFIVAVPMPDISEFFEAWQYFPHNSIVWIWIKTGFFGFATMLYMFARTIQRGASRLATITSPDDLAMMVGALAYVVMFVVFAYVDIGWDIRPAIFLALCMAIVVDLPAEQHKRELRT